MANAKNQIRIVRRSEWTVEAVLVWSRRSALEERTATASLWKLGAELQIQAGILKSATAIGISVDTLTVEGRDVGEADRFENVIRLSAATFGLEVA